MPVKSRHRWEEIIEFVPRTSADSPYKRSTFIKNHSGTSRSSLPVVPERKPQFRFDPTKYFEPPRPKYKSPVIVYSTPPGAPPPRPRGRFVAQTNGVLNADMPQMTCSEAKDVVPAVSSSITPDDHNINTAESGWKSVEKVNSLFTIIRGESLNVCEEDTPSATLAEESISITTNENVNYKPPEEHIAVEVNADTDITTSIHDVEVLVENSESPLISKGNILERPTAFIAETPLESSSTHLTRTVGGDKGEDLKPEYRETKDKSIAISVDDTGPAPASPPEIISKSTFNWADDVIEEEETPSSTRAFTWIEQVSQYTRHFTPNSSDLSAENGPRIAEIITPAHSCFTGGRSALVLTTVGIGAEAFTSWDTTIMGSRMPKRKLSVILEEPISGRKGFFANHEGPFEHRSTAADVKVICKKERDKVEKVYTYALSFVHL